MKNRFEDVLPEADERQEERFEIWMAGEGIHFSDEVAKSA